MNLDITVIFYTKAVIFLTLRLLKYTCLLTYNTNIGFEHTYGNAVAILSGC